MENNVIKFKYYFPGVIEFSFSLKPKYVINFLCISILFAEI